MGKEILEFSLEHSVAPAKWAIFFHPYFLTFFDAARSHSQVSVAAEEK